MWGGGGCRSGLGPLTIGSRVQTTWEHLMAVDITCFSYYNRALTHQLFIFFLRQPFNDLQL